MKVVITYVYPLNGADGHLDRASKFLNSYHFCPPEMEHGTVVVCNGGEANGETHYLFQSLPNLTLLEHDNSGMDIGAFQLAARTVPCDLMVFLGSNSYIKCTGWLRRAVEAFLKHGDTIYGSTGHTGQVIHGVHPHIRTTGFWMSPALLNKYPRRITRNEDRYGFEHGPACLTRWIEKQNKMPWVVAYDGEYPLPSANQIPNGYHAGDQSNVLIGDRLTQPPFHHCA